MIEPWLQDLVGVPYVEGGEDPQAGFYCTGLVRYVFKKKFNVDLPSDVHEWRIMFVNLGWPTELVPYDVVVMGEGAADVHAAVVVDDGELLHARSVCASVVLEPVKKFAPAIRSAWRLKQ